MTVAQEVIAWKVLRENYLLTGVPIEQPVLVEPELTLVFSPKPGRLGMRLRIDPGRNWTCATRLQNMIVRQVMLSGHAYVEVLTSSEDLFRPVYALINDVLARIADGEADCLKALELSLAEFEALVAKGSEMSREKAIGLYGELWVLQTLLATKSASIACWTGPRREAHDFRIGHFELEVKTTTSNIREHVIHGINQLNPTPSHELHLVSLRLASPGDGPGRSLNDLVAEIGESLSIDRSAFHTFRQALASAAYESDQPECAVRYQLAAPAIAVEIGKDFPVIGHDLLSVALSSGHASRLSDFRFTLNLEGCGNPFDSARYED